MSTAEIVSKPPHLVPLLSWPLLLSLLPSTAGELVGFTGLGLGFGFGFGLFTTLFAWLAGFDMSLAG